MLKVGRKNLWSIVERWLSCITSTLGTARGNVSDQTDVFEQVLVPQFAASTGSSKRYTNIFLQYTYHKTPVRCLILNECQSPKLWSFKCTQWCKYLVEILIYICWQ